MGPHILVIGAGSVGQRHMRNFKELGCCLSAFDPRLDRLKEAEKQVELISATTEKENCDQLMEEVDGIVISSPPKFHIPQTLNALDLKKPVFLEKPLCISLSEAKRLMSHPLACSHVLLGYTYRWWPPLAKFREKLLGGVVGKPLYAEFTMSAHLADWHPWERYQDFFMASSDLGGGALLDESHFVDLMLWFFGKPKTIYGRAERISKLEIQTDDNVDILAEYTSGLRVNIHLDLYGRPHRKHIYVIGEEGSIEWSFDPNQIRYSSEVTGGWQIQGFQHERNDMFLKAALNFKEIVNSNVSPQCTVADGVKVLEVLEAVRETTKTGTRFLLGGD